MIDAMPSILKRRADAVYVVLGATHPNLVRHEGEAYRERLMARVRALGIEQHVVFLNQFVDLATLLDFISFCDVYVTPYLNEAQMTSGTLAYSFGLGKAVVSTPYWHAQELLADGRGVLVPFGDAVSIGDEIAGLLTDDARRQRMRQQAYASSRSMTWERTAERYLDVFENVQQSAWPDCARCRTAPLRRRCSWTTCCRCATTRACCSMRCTRCLIENTATVSTTMRARCSWLARSTRSVRSVCPKR